MYLVYLHGTFSDQRSSWQLLHHCFTYKCISIYQERVRINALCKNCMNHGMFSYVQLIRWIEIIYIPIYILKA